MSSLNAVYYIFDIEDDYRIKLTLFQFHLHDSKESLAKEIPLDILPKDYGGNEKSLDELEGNFVLFILRLYIY